MPKTSSTANLDTLNMGTIVLKLRYRAEVREASERLESKEMASERLAARINRKMVV